ncbi:glycosyltransferase family 2 protein [Pedobacter sp. L105]|uniref:glycosyltransferase family 2 protein n=1 Tax=Pedobacter sp. L105 TaxID=1641871 RepID=UPI00131E07F2|nr:glycosyltransferase family 2 protein [Pedobacter sp. L105]
MLISIVTVVFNAVDTIEETIKSVIDQKNDDIEYIIIDGQSSDGTVDVIKKYDDKISYWISEPDKGIYDALNKGVSKIKGDFVLFLGADDTLNNVLRNLNEYLIDTTTIYYGNAYMTRSKINYAGKFDIFKISHQNICQQAIFYPATVFERYKFDVTNKVHADYQLNLLLYSDIDFKFQFLNRVICNYSETGFSTLNKDNFYSIGRFDILKSKYPFYVYLYSKARYIVTKILKKNYD